MEPLIHHCLATDVRLVYSLSNILESSIELCSLVMRLE